MIEFLSETSDLKWSFEVLIVLFWFDLYLV